MRNDSINSRLRLGGCALCLLLFIIAGCAPSTPAPTNDAPQEVLFWHFWGGRDRAVVEDIVGRFNASQHEHRVRAIAMPGNNLDLKFLLSVAGGDPPDLVNQDDPVVADWASRGILTPLADLASADELAKAQAEIFPAALALGTYEGELYALANGLDIRALYVNRTLLAEHDLAPPSTLSELDHLAETIAPPGAGDLKRVGFLPDPRRLWAWGAVFGGRFYNPAATKPDRLITADSPEILAALEWMASYSEKYGPSRVAEFRTGDQSLPGAAFPLLTDRRYAAIMDGQWRIRDIRAYREERTRKNLPADEIAVVPLPPPPGGKRNAGWVNGNFFVVPNAAKNPTGAWEFMKFWSGLDGHEAEAARACAAGGWIPVTQTVVDQPAYQELLQREPLMRVFVNLATSPHQHPTPPIRLAPAYLRAVNSAAEDVLYRGAEPRSRLKQAAEEIRARLNNATAGEH